MTHRGIACLCAVMALGGTLLVACAPSVVSPPTPTAYGVEVVPRAEWGAQPPSGTMRPHEIDRITIHHTAMLQEPERPLDDKLQGLQQFSQAEAEIGEGFVKAAWADIPYHFFIDAHGTVAEARSVRYAGDTNTAYDPAGHLLIVLEGNFEEDVPTAAQLAALEAMVHWGADRWSVPAELVQGHSDYAATLCPGENLKPHLPRLRESLQRGR